MAARRRTTLATVSSASLNSRTSVGASSSRSSMAPTKQTPMATSAKPSRFSISSAGGSGRSIGGGRQGTGVTRPSMGGGRPSMGGGKRPSMGGGKRPSMGRQSMATGDRKSSTGVRRSSAYGSGSAGRSDPRPLMDKAYLNESLHKLADYLSSHGYDQPINNKNLSRPSGRDFNNIMGFLFRQIDPNYVPSGRFEDDVVPFLKMVRYPFTISRSSLAAVGAPQTWPKVMGAISWLVDSLLYEESAATAEEDQRLRREEATHEQREQDEEDGVNDQGAHLKDYLSFLGEAYSYFLEGDDDATSAVEADYLSARDADNAGFEQRTKELEEIDEGLARQCQELEEQSNSLPKLEESLRLAQSDRDKYAELLEQLKTHKQTLQEKMEKRLQEEKRLKEALLPVREANASLRQQISRQEFSAEDVERQAAERRRVKEAMLNAQDAKAKARKEGWTAQAEASKCKELLKEQLLSYETKAKGLLLLPNGAQPARNGGDIDYEVLIDEARLEQGEGALTNDVRGVICPAINGLKVAVMRRTQELRQDLSNLLVEEDKVEEEITDVESELEILRKQVKRKEETYSKEKHALDQKMAAGKRGLEDEERRLESLGTAEDLDLLTHEHYAAVDVLRMEIEALKERQEMELQQGENILHTALEVALDYKEREEKCLAGLKERYRQHHAAIAHDETPFDAVMADALELEGGSAPQKMEKYHEGSQVI